MIKKPKNDETAADLAIKFVWELHNNGLDFKQADFNSLSDDQALEMACLLYIESTPDCRHEALSSGDTFDCYAELMIHNPIEFLNAMQRDFIEYYSDEIYNEIERAIISVSNQIMGHYLETHTRSANKLSNMVTS
jgi:hypothetical protein